MSQLQITKSKKGPENGPEKASQKWPEWINAIELTPGGCAISRRIHQTLRWTFWPCNRGTLLFSFSFFELSSPVAIMHGGRKIWLEIDEEERGKGERQRGEIVLSRGVSLLTVMRSDLCRVQATVKLCTSVFFSEHAFQIGHVGITGNLWKAVPRFGESCSCWWLPLLPQLACSILAA